MLVPLNTSMLVGAYWSPTNTELEVRCSSPMNSANSYTPSSRAPSLVPMQTHQFTPVGPASHSSASTLYVALNSPFTLHAASQVAPLGTSSQSKNAHSFGEPLGSDCTTCVGSSFAVTSGANTGEEKKAPVVSTLGSTCGAVGTTSPSFPCSMSGSARLVGRRPLMNPPMGMHESFSSMMLSPLVSCTTRQSTMSPSFVAAARVGTATSSPAALTAVPPLLPPAMVASVFIQARLGMPGSEVKPETEPSVKVMVSPPMPG